MYAGELFDTARKNNVLIPNPFTGSTSEMVKAAHIERWNSIVAPMSSFNFIEISENAARKKN
jgi:hypothetical protein